MSQQLSKPILWGQSFKRQDLAGVSFRKKDIRLCDLSYANLEGADFYKVMTGQCYQVSLFMGAIFSGIYFIWGCFSSSRDYFTLFLNSLLYSALGFTLSVLSAGQLSFQDFWYPIKFFINLITALFTGGIAWIIFNDSLPKAFLKGDITTGIASGIFAIFLIWLTYILLHRSFNTVVNATGTNFTGARLNHANFTKAVLRNCDFTKASLDHVNWTDATFKRCKFQENSNLEDPKVINLCTSRRSKIEKDFSSANLSELNLVGVDLYGTNLNAAILDGANLSNADLRKANLNEAKLNGANLSNADLRKANLSNTHAIQTDFTGANLSGACITRLAITTETNFTDVICSHFFTDLDKKERKPASGFFEKDDFAKFIFGSKDYELIRQELEDSQLQRSRLQQELDQIRSSSQNNTESFKLEKQISELEKQISELEKQIEKPKQYHTTVVYCENYNHIEQHGKGDNIAGDKVVGHKIG